MPKLKFSPQTQAAIEKLAEKNQESISKMRPATPEEFTAQYERLNGKSIRNPDK